MAIEKDRSQSLDEEGYENDEISEDDFDEEIMEEEKC